LAPTTGLAPTVALARATVAPGSVWTAGPARVAVAQGPIWRTTVWTALARAAVGVLVAQRSARVRLALVVALAERLASPVQMLDGVFGSKRHA
jgi:hypothetical protein